MRLALISDIHANVEALRATLADIAGRVADRIVCLGDIVGYNANPAECIALVREANALCVAGNHDLAVCGRMPTKYFPATAARAVAWTQRRLSWRDLQFLAGLPLKAHVESGLVAVHGALHPQTASATVRLDTDEKRQQSFQALIADRSGARLGAFGHTHQIGIYEFRPHGGAIDARGERTTVLRDDAYYLLNPGSVGQPRSTDTRASYMMVDLAERSVAVHRVAYDREVALAATRQAGLAPALSFGPLRGAIGGGLRALRLDRPVRGLAAYLGL